MDGMDDPDFEKQIEQIAEKETAGRRKHEKLTLSALPEALQPVQWSASRPKPKVSPFWDDEATEELAKYIDWHHNHPHCVTPRKVPADTESRLMRDPENPGKIYTRSGVRIAPLPATYQPPALGAGGATAEVSSVAARREYDEMNQLDPDEDRWYVMSVKDQLEQSHYDGSHTTLKYKPAKAKFDKDAAWQIRPFEDYEGGAPPIQEKQSKLLLDFALKEKAIVADKNPKLKVSPWAPNHKYSKFTEGGTALDAFKKKEMNMKVEQALKLFEESQVSTDRETTRSSSRKKSSRKKKSSQDKMKTPVEKMRDQLGGDKNIAKMNSKWVKLAKKVTKESKLQKSIVDTSINLLEACAKLRVVKVASLLLTGQADANMLTGDEEPIFLHTFARANTMDEISSSLRPADQKSDVADRVKLQQILDLLVKYKADINTVLGKERVGAIHQAAMADNTKMIAWLVYSKADVSLWSGEATPMTPLMKAGKHGNIYALADLIRLGADINLSKGDGMTALHWTAMFGQTNAALFLLRVGADKKIQTSAGKTAAAIAGESRFLATSQAIAAIANPDYKAGPQLEYLVEEEERRNAVQEKSTLEKLLGGWASAFSNNDSSRTLSKFFIRSWNAISKFWRNTFCRFARIDPEDDDDEEDDEDNVDNIEELEAKLGQLENASKDVASMEAIPEVDQAPIVIYGDDVIDFEDSQG